jgi:broad specificity phosphatase PhoE
VVVLLVVAIGFDMTAPPLSAGAPSMRLHPSPCRAPWDPDEVNGPEPRGKDGSLVLVRHGRTVVDPNIPAPQWRLDPAAIEPCRSLGELLPAGPVVSSPEPKAIETARAIGRPVSVDERLREIERPWVGGDDFEASVARYLAGERVDGWEPQAAALARFAESAHDIIVSHGTVMSLYVGAATGADAFEFWRSLTMPDAWELSADGRLVRLLRPDGAVRRSP